METVMYVHGGSENHGCEAIVRTTAEILKMKDSHPTLLSYNRQEDIKYGLENVVEIIQEIQPINKKSLSFIKAYLIQKITGKYHLMDVLMHAKAINQLSRKDMAFFIGGDNYCYSDAKNYRFINQLMKRRAKKLVLWGTSVEPEVLEDPEIRKDIMNFDYIVARESISYEALKTINPNTFLYPDPAFYLPSEKIDLPANFQNKNTVGINISPLIIEKEKEEGCILQNYENLIEYIIENTGYQIALIPHVIWKSNDDRKPLQKVYDKYKNSGRILMIDDHNCMQQKYIISQCKFFVGARTHSTIAAYSTCVPTLVVGYSVKARGIAKDLFGEEKNYLVSAQQMKRPEELTEAFKWIEKNEKKIVECLRNKKEEYKKYRTKYLEGIC